jgi:hypothetical protein
MASSADSPRAVRIATLNTWGMRGNWAERRRVLSDGLLALDADLLTLQETIVNGGYDQAADVLEGRYEIIQQQDREADGQGITTASRWPVGEIIELDINVTSRTGDFACASLITEILAPTPLGASGSSTTSPTGSPTTSTNASSRQYAPPPPSKTCSPASPATSSSPETSTPTLPPPASGSGPDGSH